MRLSPEERDEYEAVVLEAFGNGGTTRQKGVRFEQLLLDAEQAHRPWAALLLAETRLQGLIAKGRRDFQRLNEVPVSYEGDVLGMPKALSVRKRNDEGETVHQLAMISFHSWDDVIAKARSLGNTIRGYQATQAGLLRLLLLREDYPETDGPAEACKLAGTTIEAVVFGEEGAA